MAIESDIHQSPGGVRTYRGRTLEELLPQIRAELGPDAIILREREGLVGGVGGFFAQRFIEVDARRGEGQSIDIYDDAPEADLRLRPQPYSPPLIEEAKPKAELPPEPAEIGRKEPPLPPVEPPKQPEPRLFVPPTVRREQPSPPSAPRQAPIRKFETTVFMDRLREASASIPDDDVVDVPETHSEPANEPRQPRKPRAPAKSKAAAKPKPQRRRQTPATSWSDELTAAPVSEPPPDTTTARDMVAAIPREAAPKPAPKPPAARKPAPKRSRQPRAAAAPPRRAPTPPAPQPANPYETVRRRPRSVTPERLGPARKQLSMLQPSVTAPARNPASGDNGNGSGVGTALAVTTPVTRPETPVRDEAGLRGAIGRLVEGLRPSGPTKPAPPRPLDVTAASEVATELATRGASQAWTTQVINAAGAHGNALSGNLREAAEAEVARRIVPAPALPTTGAAIAFIGSGGSGKTRCTAALASAYRRNSTLEVTVIALDNPEGARELRKLLKEDGVPVLSLHGAKATRAVAEGRNGGLVIVDTPTATPTDPSGIQALGEKLATLALDAVYVALPATLGPQAARRALASFGALKPAAVAITHADETDQLAVVVEIAIGHRIPLAYFHSGTDHTTALSVVDPPTVAQQLLS